MNKDIPRNVPRAKVRVKSRTKDFIMPNGVMLKMGVDTETIIYEDEVDKVYAMVETQVDDIARADRKAKDTIEKLADARPSGVSKEDAKREIAKSISKEAAFELIVGRSLLPLVSCEVLERRLPPPEKEAEFNALAASQKVTSQQNAELAKLVASSVATEVARVLRPESKSSNNQR